MAAGDEATQEAGRALADAAAAIREHGPLSPQATQALRAGAFTEINARAAGATSADIADAITNAQS
ncbi:hypothetical protein ACIP9H_33910 [Streptomyces sp. NPDC088732]|uniref:hypothetical protein n=1 Tax=Streptomyces sp. NPDC088732 TaxID=3365879 RepID=UPI00380BA896